MPPRRPSDFLTALAERSAQTETVFTLVVPASPSPEGRSRAAEVLEAARAAARERELELPLDGRVGDCDPLVAVVEEWTPARYDEIIVFTLPSGRPSGLEPTSRIGSSAIPAPPSATSSPRRRGPAHLVHAEHHDDFGVLKPLTVLTWGRPRERPRERAHDERPA